jgi:RNA recognition motif-containing protein
MSHASFPINSTRNLRNITPSTNIFINYLPNDFTEADLNSLCQEYGIIQSLKICVDLKTFQSKCYGFVNFSTIQEADHAIYSLNGKKIGIKRLLVKYSCSKVYNSNSPKIIQVIGFATDTTEQELFNCFSSFGRIENISFYFQRFAHITFLSAKSANQATLFMDGQSLREGRETITVTIQETDHFSFLSTINYFNYPLFHSQQNSYDYLVDNIDNENENEINLSEIDDFIIFNNQTSQDYVFTLTAQYLRLLCVIIVHYQFKISTSF